MSRARAAFLAAALMASSLEPATAACARAAEPFPVVPLPAPARRPSGLAYASIGTGAALIGVSFVLGERANDRYAEYLAATDPEQIEKLYDRTRRYDHWSTASLVGGEALIALGVYLRFLRTPAGSRVTLDVRPQRCALSLRF